MTRGKRFYEQQFGVESANTVINRMKQKKVVSKWRLLYEAKQKEREEAKNRMAKKLKQSYAESQATMKQKLHALMRRNALRRNSLSHQSIPGSAKQNNILQSNPDSSSRNGKPVARKQLLYLIFSGFLMRRKTLVPIEFLQFMALCHQGASLALVSYRPPVSFGSL
ncbi:unnamed protein product [Musa acuminata subsp. burmannicoides]